MHILLNTLAKQHPVEFNQQWIQQNFSQAHFEWLVQERILVKAQPKQTVACPSCDDFHPLHKDEQGYYCVCGGYFSGRENIADELVHRWRVSLTGLASFLARQLEIKPDITELLDERVWRVGRKKYQNRQFFLTMARVDAKQVLQRLEQQSQPAVVFWIGHDGQLPQTNRPKALFLSLNDFIFDDEGSYSLSTDDVSKQVKTFIGQSNPDSPVQITQPSYSNGIIDFCHQKIILGRAVQQKLVCNTLFQSDEPLTKKWSFDEIAEELDELPSNGVLSKQLRMRYYGASREINSKVAAKTQIDDLLKTDTHHVRINPKYLK